jgi:streptogramin lyase
MPFSARQGFFKTTAAPAPAVLPDYPNVPTEDQYINYLANATATSATVFNDNITPDVTVHGSTIVSFTDEDMYIIPRESGNFVKLDTSTNTYSDMTATATSNQFQGATLGLNGNIICCPFQNNNPGEYDPATDTLTTVTTTGGPSGTVSYYEALTLPDGDILCLPRNNHKMLRYTPGSTTASEVGDASGGSFTWGGFCLAPNGNVYIVPEGGSTVHKYDPVANTMSTIGTGISGKYTSAAVDNTGNVIGGPHNVSNFLHIDTSTDTVTTKTFGLTVTTGSTPITNGACTGPNGNVFFAAFNEEFFYEIDGSAETGTKYTSSVSQPKLFAINGGHSGSVYAQSQFSDKAFRFDCNANTSINDANVQFTYTLTPVGSMSS